VYSTCTIFSEENIDNVKKFLSENPNFETVEVVLPENVSFIEDEIKGKTIVDKYLDGFYIVKLVKN
ncbi:MAG: 16S rRNA (cytosine(967)-C(5))-methyltransferase RsmB, partial [Fusobacteriaceae bacterium]|nr:16S rRNA (cytosine(967)-C(5))-methyltransferase RsmB [Fusobacteriaceae bacterium]